VADVLALGASAPLAAMRAVAAAGATAGRLGHHAIGAIVGQAGPGARLVG